MCPTQAIDCACTWLPAPWTGPDRQAASLVCSQPCLISVDLPGDCWAALYPEYPELPSHHAQTPQSCYPGTSLCWAVLPSPVLTHTSLVLPSEEYIHPEPWDKGGTTAIKHSPRSTVKVITIFIHHLILWKIKYPAF